MKTIILSILFLVAIGIALHTSDEHRKEDAPPKEIGDKKNIYRGMISNKTWITYGLQPYAGTINIDDESIFPLRVKWKRGNDPRWYSGIWYVNHSPFAEVYDITVMKFQIKDSSKGEKLIEIYQKRGEKPFVLPSPPIVSRRKNIHRDTISSKTWVTYVLKHEAGNINIDDESIFPLRVKWKSGSDPRWYSGIWYVNHSPFAGVYDITVMKFQYVDSLKQKKYIEIYQKK